MLGAVNDIVRLAGGVGINCDS
jgi:hypothetical protein